ncbi:MAG: peptidoglycan DD-metalloendopeptidase family protein, partial [Lachnospiraceae bacterium]|nr:peptidoglycan DD-metalloendopeptidase family protein [Lachnospiraceae bacterium]
NMKNRIRFMYENRMTANYLAALFEADSFSEFLNEVEYITSLEKYDREMLLKYEEAKEKVSDTKSTLETEKEELAAMQEEVSDSKEALVALLSEKKAQLDEIDENIEVAEDSAEVYEAEIAAQEELIEQIRAAEAAKKAKIEEEKAKKAAEEAAKKAAEEAAKKAAEEAAAAAATESSTEDGTETSTESSTETESEPSDSTDTSSGESESQEGDDSEEYTDTYTGGVFTWPCPSSTRITSDYGPRISPTSGASSNHKGIDIGAAYGADIVAAADGDVIAATYSSSGGNYVMIDHGGGVYTVYMHASELCVSPGTAVKAGEVIAKVGSTGISTGNHLHFGVSVGGEYVSPWTYLQ